MLSLIFSAVAVVTATDDAVTCGVVKDFYTGSSCCPESGGTPSKIVCPSSFIDSFSDVAGLYKASSGSAMYEILDSGELIVYFATFTAADEFAPVMKVKFFKDPTSSRAFVSNDQILMNPGTGDFSPYLLGTSMPATIGYRNQRIMFSPDKTTIFAQPELMYEKRDSYTCYTFPPALGGVACTHADVVTTWQTRYMTQGPVITNTFLLEPTRELVVLTKVEASSVIFAKLEDSFYGEYLLQTVPHAFNTVNVTSFNATH
jgi:hypothetical protein